MANLIEQIKEDMDVYDSDGDKIGSVEAVQFPSAGTTPDTKGEISEEPPLAAAAAYNTNEGKALVLPTVDEMVELPEAIRARLRMHGFFKLDTSILHSDRLVIVDQIESVDDDGVRLKVERDDLVEI